MAEAAAAGFRSVINNRPDFEGGPTQPTNASIEAAARAAGLSTPPAGGAELQTPEEIARFAALLDDAAQADARVLPLAARARASSCRRSARRLTAQSLRASRSLAETRSRRRESPP